MQRRVLIRGIVFNYEEKAPYVPSGRSIQGALEMDESGTRVKCHECGRFWRHVAFHAKAHGISARAYRLKHGLRYRTKLCAPAVAQLRFRQVTNRPRRPQLELALAAQPAGVARAARGPAFEVRNLHNHCAEQLIARIRRIAKDLRATPSGRQLKRAGVQPITAQRNLGVKSVDELMERCGLEPNYQGLVKGESKYSEQILIELLRDAHVALARPLRHQDCRAPLLPSLLIFQKFFGSWTAALHAAGLRWPMRGMRWPPTSSA